MGGRDGGCGTSGGSGVGGGVVGGSGAGGGTEGEPACSVRSTYVQLPQLARHVCVPNGGCVTSVLRRATYEQDPSLSRS
eukprot:4279679-Prymnesium_polylepis.1